MPTAPRRRFAFLAVPFILPLACAEPGPPEGMQLVAPGSPNQSYLVHKLENSHLGQGGCGVQMPFGGSLDPAQLTLVRDWITAGAPRN